MDLFETEWDIAFRTGKETEQERIIKLLEDECEGDWPKVIEMSLDSLKTLIKGEQPHPPEQFRDRSNGE